MQVNVWRTRRAVCHVPDQRRKGATALWVLSGVITTDGTEDTT